MQSLGRPPLPYPLYPQRLKILVPPQTRALGPRSTPPQSRSDCQGRQAISVLETHKRTAGAKAGDEPRARNTHAELGSCSRAAWLAGRERGPQPHITVLERQGDARGGRHWERCAMKRRGDAGVRACTKELEEELQDLEREIRAPGRSRAAARCSDARRGARVLAVDAVVYLERCVF
ncbi:hypothetical protein CONPUDRAFT_152871 [Coniophora puteana RWD-64-598 SS2]|uniref:Uncharacterized protein n=1 Tax=Coniophora puteana (strain RWD-64-598) TaxID=741705 RepID=A0A5M3MS46_CONPW|nr:uncharacterized protein CONPUDRAFT_152871 [Coniophora puteana RWD-64-598 SS2]EIW81979.1 hypothetical protein CONPUDRAFT_152871 [Coniophora puteana RWD-64-598 SS2]